MSNTPRQATPTERMARALTDATLATRIEAIAHNRRRWGKEDTEALLYEAARRLRWERNSENEITNV